MLFSFGGINLKKGLSVKYKRLYQAWSSMIYRCSKPTHFSYNRYGAKGITVCEEWQCSFEPFLEWALNNGYSDTLTLDRIDSSKPYQLDNCRWVDYFTQEANRGMFKNNTTGHTGVTTMGNRGKYRAYISRMGKRKYLGSFETIREAVIARELALEQYERTGTL